MVGRQEPGGKDRKGGRSGGGKKEGIDNTHQSDLSTRPVALVLALTSDNFMFGSGVPEIVKKTISVMDECERGEIISHFLLG